MPENHKQENNNVICWESLAAMLCNFGILLPLCIILSGVLTWPFLLYIPSTSLAIAFGISGIRHKGRSNKIMAGVSMVIPSAVIVSHIIVMVMIWKYFLRYWNEAFQNPFA